MSEMLLEGNGCFMGKKSDSENYWSLFWQTGMPEAFGVYRLSKDLYGRQTDETSVGISGDAPQQGELT